MTEDNDKKEPPTSPPKEGEVLEGVYL